MFFFLFCPFSTSCWDVDEVAAASAATLHVGVREGKATLLLTAQTEAVVLLMVLSCGFCFFFFLVVESLLCFFSCSCTPHNVF